MPFFQELERNLDKASSERDLRDILHDLRETDNTVTGQLDQYVSGAKISQNHDMKRLELLRTQLGTSLRTSGNSGNELRPMLSKAADVSGKISSRLRRIELEKHRVQEALEYVNNVISLKYSVIGIQDAMDSRDWERAANHIHSAYQLPDDLVNGDFAKAMVPTSEIPDYPHETLQKAVESLGDLFLREFNKAADSQNMENVTRYFKLFPLIGKETHGLDVYAKFICGIITSHSRTLMQSRNNANTAKELFYAVAVSRLFENIAAIIAQHAPIVERHYGKGRMGRVVSKIQGEADSQGGLIVDTYWDERNVDKVLSQIKSYAFTFLVNSFTSSSTRMSPFGNPTASRTNSPDVFTAGNSGYTTKRSSSESTRGGGDDSDGGVDLKEVGNLVGECSVMLNRWTLYRKFIAIRWNDFDDKHTSHNEHSELTIPNVLQESGFANKASQKLIPSFESMATFVMRRSVEKAFQMDELPDLYQKYSREAPLVSSAVDDVMFILSTSVRQTVETGEAVLNKNVLGNFRRIMESDYVGILQRKLRDEAPKQLSAMSQPYKPPAGSSQKKPLAGLTGTEEKRLRAYLVYINSFSVSASYTDRIFSSLDLDTNLPFNDDAKTVKNILMTFGSSLRSKCNELINDGIQVVFTTILNVRLRGVCNAMFKDADYMVDPQDSDEQHLSVTFAAGWEDLMREFSNILAPENFAKLVDKAASAVSRMLEKWVWSLEGRINELGAIRLDRDIGKIISLVSSDGYRLRDKFVRVAQLVMILGLDEEEEEEGIGWSLKDDERERARMIRVERKSVMN